MDRVEWHAPQELTNSKKKLESIQGYSFTKLFYDEYSRYQYPWPLDAFTTTSPGNKGKVRPMAQGGFETGTRVRLREDAEENGIVDNHGYLGATGVVFETGCDDPNLHSWAVVFDDGYQESFKLKQLRLAGEVAEQASYEALPDYKNAEELGLKVGDKFIYIEEAKANLWKEGTVVTLTDDDGTRCPYFKSEDGIKKACFFKRLTPYQPEQKEESMITALYVGDTIKVTLNGCDYKNKEVVVDKNVVWMSVHDYGTVEFHPKGGGSPHRHNLKANHFEVINSKGNNMSNVTTNPLQALKEKGLDADTRLLRELGFEEADGTPKSNAIQEMQRRQWTSERTAVAKDLRTAMAAEKADAQTNTTSVKA